MIKVLDEGTVHVIPLEEFVLRALAAEMTAYGDSMEALKAQAVAIRSFVVAKSKLTYKVHKGAEICTDYNHCMAWKTEKEYDAMYKVYKDRYEQAVAETEGMVLTYNGGAAWTYFHWCSYGTTESAKDGMGGSISYLMPVYSPVAPGVEMIQKRTLKNKEVLTKLFGSEKANQILSNIVDYPLGAIAETEGGRVKTVKIYGQTVTGAQLRSALGLKSTDLTISYDYETEYFTFVALGSGHGVGMSQVGARAFAIEGKSYDWILAHYYVGTTLEALSQEMIGKK
jgi:stage II sporulation protein D